MKGLNNIKTVAVTGTNGKTSTVELARQLLDSGGHRPASLGTMGLQMKDTDAYDPILIGDEALPELSEELAEYHQVNVFIYEAYSAAIMGKLYDNLPLDIAVLTYIGEDHLEYHGSKENYVNAKLRLFRELLREKGTAIFNAGDERAAEIKQICEHRNINIFTFGISRKADLCLTDVKTHNYKSTGILNYQHKEYPISVPFIGAVFLLNWLAALSISLQSDLKLEKLLKNSRNLKLPAGRLEYIGKYKGARIYVDYAHTTDALIAVLNVLRKVTKKNLHLLFGCGGERDVSKRGQMGRIAQKYADNVYITDDNPRYEDPKEIRKQIMECCPVGIEVDDRKIAIKRAIHNLKRNDTLIIAGKGHENYQEIKEDKKYFSDKETVLEYINEVTPRFDNHELQLS